MNGPVSGRPTMRARILRHKWGCVRVWGRGGGHIRCKSTTVS
ncbi:hypothetical protein AmDm5_0214 [Acetobacter malorum]|nr:hypothetical protein AmDm5_0214 [Acetobacter malorum]